MKGQFFIITVVMLGGMLFSTSAIISSAGATDYNQVVEDHSTGVIENLGEEALSSWWNPSWLWRKSVEVEERSGLYLENESVAIDLDAKRSRVNDSCADIRVVSGGETLPWINTTSCGIDTYESDTGAVARYRLDTERSVVEDSTGNGHTGALSGAPERVSGKFDSGLDLDAGDSIEVPDNPSLDMTGEGMMVSFWIFPQEAPDGDWSQIFVKGDGSTRNYAMWFRQNENTVHFRVDPGDQGISATDTPLDPGSWYHVAGVYEPASDELRFYLDGELDRVVSGVTMDGSSDNDGWLYIGNSPNYEAADMIIDDFRIYNRSLSANKVEGIARNGIGLNVSTDLSPNEKDSLQVYYGDPFADHPEYNDSSMTSTSMDERPATSVGISRGKSEIVDKLRQQVEMMQELTGASIQIRESNGCNIIALESPRMDLRKEIC